MVTSVTRVAAYVRVSSQEQTEGYSIDGQLRLIAERCDLQGHKLVAEYVDAGVSGKSTQGRTGLNRLLVDAANNEFDAILVWKLNRLARNLKDLLEISSTLVQKQIRIVSLTEPFDISTPHGTFTDRKSVV